VFVVIERRSAAPLVPLRYFKVPGFLGGNIVLLAIGMAVNGGMGFIMTQYAQVVLGYSAVQFGLMFAVMTVLTILGSTLAGGPLVSRFGPRLVAVGGLLLMGLSFLTLTGISAHGSFTGDILVGMILFGPGLGAGFVAGSIAALAGVPERDSGFASSVTTAAFHVGGALGIAVLSTVALANAVGSNPATAMVAGFRSAYGVGLVFVGVGIVAAVAFLRGARQTAAVVTSLSDRHRDAA
jgi:MFS family permease